MRWIKRELTEGVSLLLEGMLPLNHSSVFAEPIDSWGCGYTKVPWSGPRSRHQYAYVHSYEHHNIDEPAIL